jgi:hypothetical protein
MKVQRTTAMPRELMPTLLCRKIVTQHRRNLATEIAPGRLRQYPANCYSEDPAGDEESGIALKTIRAGSFAAAQDDDIGGLFRSLLVAEKKGRKGTSQ